MRSIFGKHTTEGIMSRPAVVAAFIAGAALLVLAGFSNKH